MTGAVTHFEIYAEEPAKLAEFYRDLFGWRLERRPGSTTGGSRLERRRRAAIAGGLTYRPIAGTRGWMHYVHVASLDDAVAAAERLGADCAAAEDRRAEDRLVRRPRRPRGQHLRHLAAGPERDASAGTGVTPERR